MPPRMLGASSQFWTPQSPAQACVTVFGDILGVRLSGSRSRRLVDDGTRNPYTILALEVKHQLYLLRPTGVIECGC